MATEVFTTETISLQDGKEVELRPLVIARLRKFTGVWLDWVDFVQTNEKNRMENEDHENDDEESTYVKHEVLEQRQIQDRQYDIYTDLLVICLEKDLKGEKSAKAFRDYIEDNVYEPTTYRILDKCGALKLSPDENLVAAMERLEAAQE